MNTGFSWSMRWVRTVACSMAEFHQGSIVDDVVGGGEVEVDLASLEADQEEG
jgi:hypothetical protein